MRWIAKTYRVVGVLGFLSMPGVLSGCASAARKEDPEAEAAAAARAEEVQKTISELSQKLETLTLKLDSMEGKLGAMNDKVDATKSNIDHIMNPKKASTVAVPENVADGRGLPVDTSDSLVGAGGAVDDPEAGYVQDSATNAFRQGMIFFKGQKYSEAILSFATFIEQFPDHPLAGAAQYYVGECYMKQNEFQLASNELQRVITSYDRSSHVAETLKSLAIAEDQLKHAEEAQKYRQSLVAMFPNSPAAIELTENRGALDAAAPAPSAVVDMAPAATPETAPAPTADPTAPVTVPAPTDVAPAAADPEEEVAR